MNAVNRGAREKCRLSFFLQKKTVGHLKQGSASTIRIKDGEEASWGEIQCTE